MILPGDSWPPNPPVNPSYIAPAEYRAFAGFTGSPRWGLILRVTERWLTEHAAPSGLLPDWVQRDGSPASAPSDAQAGDFGYDAARVPIRLLPAVPHDAAARSLLARQWSTLRRFAESGPAAGYTLDGKPLATYTNAVFLSSIAAAGRVDPGSSEARTALFRLETWRSRTYYGASLRVLTLAEIAGLLP